MSAGTTLAPAPSWPAYLALLSGVALQLESLVVDGGSLTAATELAAAIPAPPDGPPPAELAAEVAQARQLVVRVVAVLERQRDVLAEDIAAVPLRSRSGTGSSDHTSLGQRLDTHG